MADVYFDNLLHLLGSLIPQLTVFKACKEGYYLYSLPQSHLISYNASGFLCM